MSKLVYVIGASGSGKDSILSVLRQQLVANADESNKILIAHRYITRDWQAGNENSQQLSQMEFMQRQQLGLFALHWQANGLHYGIGMEINLWLEKGCCVVVNGSREYLPEAKARYGDRLAPVLVQVDVNVLRQRLQDRGRESQQEIEARLARSQQTCADPLVQEMLNQSHILPNNTKVEEAAQALQSYIHTLWVK